jgi:predicted DNA-binding antitoxin AbrB/MazE fold protein
MKKNVKKVQIKESELVKIIDKIVTETVKSRKRQWIRESEKKHKKNLSEQVNAIITERLSKV